MGRPARAGAAVPRLAATHSIKPAAEIRSRAWAGAKRGMGPATRPEGSSASNAGSGSDNTPAGAERRRHSTSSHGPSAAIRSVRRRQSSHAPALTPPPPATGRRARRQPIPLRRSRRHRKRLVVEPERGSLVDVGRQDLVRSRDVGQRARDPQDPAVAACREPIAVVQLVERALRVARRPRELVQQAGVELCVAGQAVAASRAVWRSRARRSARARSPTGAPTASHRRS